MEAKLTAQPVRPSLHLVEQLREDGCVRLTRCWPEGGAAPVLVVMPVQEHPPVLSLQRLEHEYALRAELDPAWAVHPLELRHEGGRMLLVLADPGGWTLERNIGTPFEIGHFFRLAIPLA